MTHYTPGPWNVHKLPDGSHHVMADHWGASVALTLYPDSGSEGREANARLIAAAPDMLKALEMIASAAAEIDPSWDLDPAAVLAICNKAINKAIGE